MVDPNRKINRLSDEDAAFLIECEQEFRNRYTDADEEFASFIAKPSRLPPIVEPWLAKQRHHGDSGANWNRNNYRSNNRNQYNRNNDNRMQRQNNRHHYHNRNHRRDGDYGGHGQHGQGSSHSW